MWQYLVINFIKEKVYKMVVTIHQYQQYCTHTLWCSHALSVYILIRITAIPSHTNWKLSLILILYAQYTRAAHNLYLLTSLHYSSMYIIHMSNISSTWRQRLGCLFKVSKDVVALLREGDLVDRVTNKAMLEHEGGVLPGVSTINETLHVGVKPVHQVRS